MQDAFFNNVLRLLNDVVKDRYPEEEFNSSEAANLVGKPDFIRLHVGAENHALMAI